MRRPINLPSRDGETMRLGATFSQGFGPRIQPQAFAGAFPGNFRRPGAGNPPGRGAAAARGNAAVRPPGQGRALGQDQAGAMVADQSLSAESNASPPPDAGSPADAGLGRAAPGDGQRVGAPGAGGEGPGGGGFGGPGGFGGRGGGGFRGGRPGIPPQVGRVSFSIFYTSRLTDTVVLAPGQRAIDLLKNAALGGDGGGGADKVEFESGLNWRGMGLRLSGTWNSSYRVPGALTVQDLKYGDVTTIGARAFFDFNSYPDLLRKHPLLRSTRIVLRVINLFDAAPKVRDETGAVPYAYQRDLLAPKGVSWEIGLRKLFQ